MEEAIYIGIIIGVVEAIQAAYDKKWKVVATIIGAGATGALIGLVSPLGLLAGISLGLASSGAVTLAKKV